MNKQETIDGLEHALFELGGATARLVRIGKESNHVYQGRIAQFTQKMVVIATDIDKIRACLDDVYAEVRDAMESGDPIDQEYAADSIRLCQRRGEDLADIARNLETTIEVVVDVLNEGIRMTHNEPHYLDVHEMSDDTFMALREESLKDRDTEMYGGEFMKDVWRHPFEYRGIRYNIAMMRYLSSRGNIGTMNAYGKWFVLEYPEETNRIVKIAKTLDKHRDFLYRDTLHEWNDGQTLSEMFYTMVHDAKADIDWFLDDALGELTQQVNCLEDMGSDIQNCIERDD